MNKRNIDFSIKVFVVFALIVVGLFLSVNVQASDKSVAANSIRLTSPLPGEFPIVAVTVFNLDRGPQKGDLNGVKDCGFNLCMGSMTNNQIEKLLEYMEGSGLKLMIHSPSFLYNSKDKTEKWKREIPQVVKKFKDNPLVAGWEFKDEPKWDDLPELRKRWELLRKTDPDHFILINLVGELAKDFTGPCKTLTAYLDSIQNVFDMDVWSSDFYPIWIRNGKFSVNYRGFYGDLAAYAAKSKATGIPMWAYCESMEYTSKHHSRPAATVPYLTFEAFSALAYGAQGLVYWTYWQRPSNSVETYKSALVDLDGKKTKAWYAAKSVNQQVKVLSPVFLGAQMIECLHTGVIDMPGTLPYIGRFGPLEELTNDVKGVLVSHLKNGDHNYLLVVNHDVISRQKIKMKFRNDVKVSELKVGSNKFTKKEVKRNYNTTLSSGGYVIFEWE